jgi:hypothetical protein
MRTGTNPLIMTAGRGVELLGESKDLVARFLLGQFNPDGGGRGRNERSDLYYTVFALQGLAALGVRPPWEAVRPYLAASGDGSRLDLIHLASLVRCW